MRALRGPRSFRQLARQPRCRESRAEDLRSSRTNPEPKISPERKKKEATFGPSWFATSSFHQSFARSLARSPLQERGIACACVSSSTPILSVGSSPSRLPLYATNRETRAQRSDLRGPKARNVLFPSARTASLLPKHLFTSSPRADGGPGRVLLRSRQRCYIASP